MSFGSLFRKVAKVARAVAHSPVAKVASSFVPGATLALGAADVAMTASSVFGGGGGGGGTPSLPSMPTMARLPVGAPAGLQAFAPNAAAAIAQKYASGGKSGFNPFEHMNTGELQALESAGIITGFARLPVYRRAPKGMVIVHVGAGMIGVRRDVAKAMGLWKPAQKAPITAADMRALNKSNSIVRKLKTMEKRVKKVANFRAGGAKRPPLQVVQTPGRKLIARKAS